MSHYTSQFRTQIAKEAIKAKTYAEIFHNTHNQIIAKHDGSGAGRVRWKSGIRKQERDI